jgi:predicted DNA binding protein
MWKTKIRLKHDCLFGENCSKAGVVCINVSFNPFKKGGFYYIYHFGTVFGENFDGFLKLLKKDKRVNRMEAEGRTFVVVEKRRKKDIPGMYVTPELIYIKPVYVNKDGYETWELASLDESVILDFIRHFPKCEVVYIKRTALKDIYFPRLSPDLTRPQRDALQLATKEGYYTFPHKVHLDKLAEKSGLSKSAFREHLRRAEMKVLGDLSG